MTTVEVFMDEKGSARLVGQAHFTRTRGKISTTFLYALLALAQDCSLTRRRHAIG